MQPGSPQPAGAASSPYTLNIGEPITYDGPYVELRPGAYDPGSAGTSVYALTAKGEIIKVEITAHHVELVNGKSAGVKIAELHLTGGPDGKINCTFGEYSLRELEVGDGQLTVEACVNNGKPDSLGNPTLQWSYATITGAPLAGIKPLTIANLRALIGGGSGGSGSDPDAIHAGDTVKIVRG